MALLPLLVFAGAGNGTWVAFIVALLALMCIGYCAAQFARRINSAGSFYVWVSKALRPLRARRRLGPDTRLHRDRHGYRLRVRHLRRRPPDQAQHPGGNRGILVALFLLDTLLATGVAVFDMGVSARAALILWSISVTVILILCVNIWVHNGGVFDTHQLKLTGVKPGGVLVGVVLAIFAFVGFEERRPWASNRKTP